LTVAAIIVCEMIEDETRLALARAFPEGGNPPLVWIESSLHERPQKLQLALQKLLDRLDEGARVGETVAVRSVRPGEGPAGERNEPVDVGPVGDLLLGFGYCGGGLKGLLSRERRLIFPRVDDCISLFLNRDRRREEVTRDAHSYYLTKGWLCHQNSVSEIFDTWDVRYGTERATKLRRLMFANYERLSLVDTGAYDVSEWIAQSKARAEKLELAHEVVPGSVQMLEKLFAGDPGADCVVLEPGCPIGIEHLLGEGG
jgi:hypothetical protein